MKRLAVSLLVLAAIPFTAQGESCTSALKRLPVPTLPRDCLLEPGDAVYIFLERECTWAPQTIRLDGKIGLGPIGGIPAANSTPAQLEGIIAHRLSEYLNQPKVRVMLVDNIRKKYFVEGNVSHHGEFTLDVEITVREAIEKAGGFNRDANTNAIVVSRGNIVIKLKYKRLLKRPEENIRVENGDHIIIQ